jgi:phosphatidylinositol kinase/protein kinase (PI-3  family)
MKIHSSVKQEDLIKMFSIHLGFEQSPFKFTPEFVEVMGGPESELFNEFKVLLLEGLKAARKQQDRIVNIVEIMRSSELATRPFAKSSRVFNTFSVPF